LISILNLEAFAINCALVPSLDSVYALKLMFRAFVQSSFYMCAFTVVEQGVMKTINVNKLTEAGCKVKIWIADWFAQLNNKMGGDLKKIKTVGEYLIEIWKAVGMDIDGDKVEFLWSSDEINSRAHEYWPLVMDIARRNKLPRIMRYLIELENWMLP